LAILCTRHVLHIWTQVWPENDIPQQLLATTEQYLLKMIDFDTAWDQWNQLSAPLENFSGDDAFINVGFAAAQSLHTALYDELHCPDNTLDESLKDDDLDADSWDASYYAAAAYAGGFVWQEASSPRRRKEFWEWYLQEAIPAVWASAPEQIV
jgi:hypothetical protein